MRRVGAVVRPGAVGDHLARLRRVLLVGQRPGRDLDEPRIGDVQLAVGHGPGHRLDEEPRRLGARPSVRTEVKALEEIQHLEQGQATRGRSRRRNLEAAVSSPNRLGYVDLVGLEVLPGDEAVVGGEVGGYRAGDIALVKHFRSVACQALEGARKVGLDHHFADRVQRTVMGVDRLRRRRDLDPLDVGHDIRSVVGRPVAMHESGDWETLPRERNRGLDRLLPRDRTEPRQRFVQPSHGARDRDRLISDVVDPTLEDVPITIGRLADEAPLPLVLSHA